MVSCGSGSAVGSAGALSLVDGSGAGGELGLSVLAPVAQPLMASKVTRTKTLAENLSCLMA